MTIFEKLMRPDLKGLKAYGSARTEAGGFKADIALDANESPWPPFGPFAAQCEVNRYPEPQPIELRQRLGAIYGVTPDQILLGRGSDEGMDLLLRLFCRAGKDEIIICPPTFGMYEVYAAVQGAAVVRVPLKQKDWQLDVKAILAACKPVTKLIFIPSPNAPMGHLMRREDILKLCKDRADKSLIVLDEAYVEFTDAPEGLIAELAKQPNLVILRTLSKSHALAGERLGVVIGSPDMIAMLNKIRAPYPLPQSTIRVVLDALSSNGLIQSAERRRILMSERERLVAMLPKSPFVKRVFPSVANFILVESPDAGALMKELRRFGILARDRSSLIPNTVRITVGSPEENDTMLRALGVTLPVPVRSPRLYSLRRATKETKIDVTVDLDTPGFLKVETGIGFFDHMLAQIASHGGFGLALTCEGDLKTGQHHTIEDCALALGEALKKALGDKRGVARFGFTAPLDEALAQVVIDLSGRPHAELMGNLPALAVGTMDSEMMPHFFRSLATSLGASIHVTVKGENTHHMIESCFKATGRALRDALRREGDEMPSTKGTL
jgi:histidinol-phosphate aminotransferase/imidazoleglycerol-phosphate dehydratase/histidinol-phosphatase